MKKALILGVTGQDGSYLAEILLEKGYEVHGLVRRSATGNTRNIQHLLDAPDIFNVRFFLQRGDLADATSLYRVISQVKPQEIYNEADQDHVAWSYDMVDYSMDITGSAVGRLLEIIKQVDPSIRFFQPCTSNMYGLNEDETQNELTRFNPQSPYAVCKVHAYYLVRYYRQAYGIFASTAILYNHESPRRTEEYVTRKISRSVARIAAGQQSELRLGDLSARIDWGYVKEYMEAAWQILQQDEADDFVIASGEGHSIKEFVDAAFSIVNLDSAKYLISDTSLYRPTKTSVLIGDTNRAREKFGFRPKVKFRELVKLMVEDDIKSLKN